MGHGNVIPELRIGMHRGMSTRKLEDLEGDMAWSSWVDPGDDVVTSIDQKYSAPLLRAL